MSKATCPRCEEGDWDNEDGTCDNCGAVNPGPEPNWDAFSDGYGDFEPTLDPAMEIPYQNETP